MFFENFIEQIFPKLLEHAASLLSSLLPLIAFLLLVIYLDRQNIKIEHKIIVIRRFKRGINLLDKLAKPKTFWKVYSTLAIPTCLLFSFLVTYMLVNYTFLLLRKPELPPGVVPVIPGTKIPGTNVYIPVLYGILAIAITALVHELAHGIIARCEGIEVKSMGYFIAFIIPGAFVEPDESCLERAKRLSKLRVYSAGSFTNIIVGLLVAAAAAFLIVNYLTPKFPNIYIINVTNSSPAEKAGLEAGMAITYINNQKIMCLEDIFKILRNKKPGDVLIVENSRGEKFKLILGKNPKTNSTYMGVYLKENSPCLKNWKFTFLGLNLITGNSLAFLKIINDKNYNANPFIWPILYLLLWTSFFNLAIGLVNLLPFLPADGGLIIKDLVPNLKEKQRKSIALIITFFIIGILLLNILVPLIRKVLPLMK